MLSARVFLCFGLLWITHLLPLVFAGDSSEQLVNRLTLLNSFVYLFTFPVHFYLSSISTVCTSNCMSRKSSKSIPTRAQYWSIILLSQISPVQNRCPVRPVRSRYLNWRARSQHMRWKQNGWHLHRTHGSRNCLNIGASIRITYRKRWNLLKKRTLSSYWK